MELMKTFWEGIVILIGGIGSYLFYQHRKLEQLRIKFEEEVKQEISALKTEVHVLDKFQAQTSVEIKEIKTDIMYIRNGLDKIIEKL